MGMLLHRTLMEQAKKAEPIKAKEKPVEKSKPSTRGKAKSTAKK